jgi:hypothetical protein
VAPPLTWDGASYDTTLAALKAAFEAERLLISGVPPAAPPFLLCGAGAGATPLVALDASAALLPRGATANCTICAQGTANSADDAESGHTCTPCPSGAFAALRGQSACEPCAPGAASSAPGAPLCDLCPSGLFASQAASETCTPCADNTFAAAPGAAACAPCAPGSISGPDAAALLSAHMYALGALSGALSDAVARRSCAALPPAPPPPSPPPPPPLRGVSAGQAAMAAAIAAIGVAALPAALWALHRKHAKTLLKLSPEELASHFERSEAVSDGSPAASASSGLEAVALLLRAAAERMAAGDAGCVVAAARDAADAATVLAEVLAADPRCPDGNAYAGALHYTRGEYVRAAARFRFAAATGAGAPRRAIAAAASAAAAAADDDPDAAASGAEEALRRDPRIPVTWLNLGNLRLAQG